MSGGPSQLDLFDYKPLLEQMNGEDLPAVVRMGQRLTGMTAQPGVVPAGRLASSSSRSTARAAPGSANCCRTPRRSPTSCASSSRCTPRPSTTTRRSRSSRPARSSPAGPSMGAWLSYGLGSDERQPAGVRRADVAGPQGDQPLYSRLWGSGFLPSQHQGVQFRRGKDPVLYLEQSRRRRSPTSRRRDARHARASSSSSSTRDVRRSRRSTRASPSTRWRTACRRACRR